MFLIYCEDVCYVENGLTMFRSELWNLLRCCSLWTCCLDMDRLHPSSDRVEDALFPTVLCSTRNYYQFCISVKSIRKRPCSFLIIDLILFRELLITIQPMTALKMCSLYEINTSLILLNDLNLSCVCVRSWNKLVCALTRINSND